MQNSPRKTLRIQNSSSENCPKNIKQVTSEEKNMAQENNPILKTGKQKMSTSQEFKKAYMDLWKQGPKVSYQNPDSWYPRN
jgi:hypothetical protein